MALFSTFINGGHLTINNKKAGLMAGSSRK